MIGSPLGPTEIREYLTEVAGTLAPAGPRHTVVIVGGALLAWHGLRAATRDVDSVRRLDEELQEAVRAVALRHDLAPAWMNDASGAFTPLTLNEADCETLIDLPRLLVLGAPLLQVFVMKMLAARDSDHDDLVALWPRLGMTPEAVLDEFTRAFPAAPEDEFLLSWIVGIAAIADGSPQPS